MDIRRKTVEAQTETRTVVDQNMVAGKKRAKKGGTMASALLEDTDTVDVSLGKSINSTVAGDREQRVAELKALIASGQYKPDAKAVAGAFLNYVNDEVWFEKMRSTDTGADE